MIFTEEDLNSLNAIADAIAGFLRSFGFNDMAEYLLSLQHNIAENVNTRK